MGGGCCVGGLMLLVQVEERWRGENKPRFSSWSIEETHQMGLLFLGYPLVFCPPLFFHQANLCHPHSSGKRRGRCSKVGGSKRVEAFEFEPTSLKRGEGLISRWLGVVEDKSR